jgi:hypothetical protein
VGLITVRVTFSDGDHLVTEIRGPLVDVQNYYRGKWFNLGQPYNPEADRMVQAVKVEAVL